MKDCRVASPQAQPQRKASDSMAEHTGSSSTGHAATRLTLDGSVRSTSARKKDWIIKHGRVLRPDGLADGDVLVADGRIAEMAPPAPAGCFDASGLLILPGIVDIHGDAFERQIMPRPGVAFGVDLALRDTDRQLLANGITTAFHGVTWSWEPGLRGTRSACAIVEAIARMRPGLGADTRVHLRHEVFNLDAESQIASWIAEGKLGCLAFNDHMEGTLKSRSRPDKVATMVERTGLTLPAFDRLVEATYARRNEVPAAVHRLAKAGLAAGLPMLSHDDTSPNQRAHYRAIGVDIAEFPVTEEVAKAAAEAGEPTVFGAPNVVRGGSHTGCPSAAEMIATGLCDILASDYYYPALTLAPFILAQRGIVSFEQAWRRVSEAPARALGLPDRGVIESGRRGDVIAVRPMPDASGIDVVATFAGGELVHLTQAWRIS
jgi:alpha-D-ribose 1-methylphosphonate 5-triphosphate diphosphatase